MEKKSISYDKIDNMEFENECFHFQWCIVHRKSWVPKGTYTTSIKKKKLKNVHISSSVIHWHFQKAEFPPKK